MVLDALPDEDFSSYKTYSACTAAIQAFPICSADKHRIDLKEPSSFRAEPSLHPWKLCKEGPPSLAARSSSAQQALPLTSKSQQPSRTKRHHVIPQPGRWRQWHSAWAQLAGTERSPSKLSPNGENSLTVPDDRATEMTHKGKSLFKSPSLPARWSVLVLGFFSRHHCSL